MRPTLRWSVPGTSPVIRREATFPEQNLNCMHLHRSQSPLANVAWGSTGGVNSWHCFRMKPRLGVCVPMNTVGEHEFSINLRKPFTMQRSITHVYRAFIYSGAMCRTEGRAYSESGLQHVSKRMTLVPLKGDRLRSAATMQAYDMTSPPVRWNHLPSPQQLPCSRQPGPVSQSAYYSTPHRTVNQRNTYQPVGLHNGHAFGSSFSQPHPSAANLQQTPGSRNDLPVPGSQPAHYSAQQQMVSQWVNLQSRGLSTRQSSQPNSGSATLQSSQASQQHSNSLQRPMLYSISAALKNPCPNVTVLHMPAAHPEASAANYPSQPFHTNTGPQGHNNTAPIQNVQFNANRVWFPQASTNGRPALENNQLRSPVPPRFQSSSGQHNLVQTMYQPAPQPQQTPATSLLPPYRSRHMVMRRSQHNVTQPQNSSPIQDHPQSYRAQNVRQSPVNHEVPTGQSSPVISPSHGPLASSAVQGQAERRISHGSSSSVSHPQFFGNIIEQVQQKLREAKQCNGVPVSGLQSTINLPLFPAQHNTESQGLQPNGTTALLPRTSPNMASLNSSSSQAPLSTHSGPVDYSRVSLLELLLESDDRQVRNQGKSPPSFSNSRAQAIERRGGPQQTASPTTSMAGGSQAHVLHYGAPSNSRTGESPRVGPASSTGEAISANEGGRLRTVGVDGAQSSRSQTNRSDKQHREVEHCTDPADCLALVLALQRAVRQVHRAVAVVPPISQQADPGQKEDVPASPDDSLPCKIAAVWTLDENGKGMEKDKAEPSVPEEMNKEPSSVTPPQVQEPIKSGKAPIVNSEKTSAGPPSFALPQNRPVAKSHGSQAPTCVIDLTESPEQQSNDLDKSCSDYATCDLSTVPVRRFSLEKLQHLVDSLEAMPADKVKHKKMEKMDVIKSILDLYWDGDLRNVLKERNAAKWLDSIAKLRVEEPHDHVLEYLEPEKLKRLPGLILKNEISLPTQFKSSWLNLDGQPADIDKVLAEPLSEYDFTWCKDGPVKIRGQDAEDLVISSQKELSETTSDSGAVNPEHNLVQVGGSNAGNLVVSTRKELKETTSDDTENVSSGSCLSEPASPATDIQCDVVMLEDPVIQKSLENQADPFQGHPKADHPTQQAHANPAGLVHSEESDGPSQSNKAELKKDHSNTRKEAVNPPLSPTTPTESPGVSTSQSGDSDHHVESEFDGDLSDASSSDSLLMKVILLTSDDASVIFKKCDKQNEPLQEMSEVLASLSPNRPNDQPGKAASSPHHAMFTCPHVTDILSDGDHFCSKCWEETPLLDVDLDESLFSPEEGEPLSVMSTPIRPVGEAQPCKQAEELTEPACSDNDGTTGSSLVCPSEIDGPEITGDPDEGQSLSPKYVNAPVVEPVGPSCSESGSPVGEEVREAYSLAGEESPKAYVQTSGRRLSLSTCRAHKKRKLFKTLSAPEGDGLFRPDVVVNAIHKPHPGVHSPGSDGQSSREEGRPPIKIRIIQTNKHSSRTEVEACKTDRKASSKPHASSPVEPQKLESPGCSPPSSQQQKDGCRKQTGPKKNVKKVKFLLYGSQNSDRDFNHRCHDREKDSSAPVYITVSAATLAGRTYSDVPSAKQKVYSQWSSSFVQKLNSPSRKKHQKTSVRELKSRITMQKQIMKDRAMSKSKGETQLTKGLKRKGHDAPTQEPKKLKATVIRDYFG
ncbi:hypothetical protein NFI96_003837 [Prochilodus magdalenae]|nr:hypothetical protein NFI96_003837 [Prochilodus magdalenae]